MCSEKPNPKDQKLVYVLNEEACKRRRAELRESFGEEINLFWIPPEKASLLRGVLAKKDWSPDGFYEGNMKSVKKALISGAPLYPIEAIYISDVVLHVTTGDYQICFRHSSFDGKHRSYVSYLLGIERVPILTNLKTEEELLKNYNPNLEV